MSQLLDEQLLSVNEAAALLRVHASTIRRWIDRGDLPAYRIGQRRVAVKRSDLDRLIAPVHLAQGQRIVELRPGERPPERLTPEEKERGLEALARLRRLHERMRAELGDRPMTPSWEILAELRDERSRQFP